MDGVAGLTQSSYGKNGNLEFVCPDTDDGFWVFWFNGDNEDLEQGAAPGQWSGGLHIVSGTRMSSVNITQVPLGPNYLEVVSVERQTASRLVWSPERGFVRMEGPLEFPPSLSSGVIATRTHLNLLVCDSESVVTHRVASPATYPSAAWGTEGTWSTPESQNDGPLRALDLATLSGNTGELWAALAYEGILRTFHYRNSRWETGPTAVVRWASVHVLTHDRQVHYLGLTVLGRIQIGIFSSAGKFVVTEPNIAPADSVTACWSTLAGGAIEIIARRAGAVAHSRWKVETQKLLSVETVMTSHAWADGDQVSLQRRVSLG